MGFGFIEYNDVYMAVTGIHDAASTPNVPAANNGTIDANRDVNVTFYQKHNNIGSATQPNTPINPTVIQLWFY